MKKSVILLIFTILFAGQLHIHAFAFQVPLHAISDENTLKNKFAVEGATKINFGGYIQTLFTADELEGANDGLKIRRARLDFRGNASEFITWRLQLDAVQPLSTVISSITQDGSKDVTAKTTKTVNRPVILDAYFDYVPISDLDFRLGQFLLPFGGENLEPNTKLETINRSQVTEKLVPGRDNGSQGRDIGIQLSSGLDFNREENFIGYAVGIFNGGGINADDDNESKDLAGKLKIFPLPNLSIGISQYIGKSGTTEANKSRTGLELNYNFGNSALKAEYITGRDASTEKYGWYIQFSKKLSSILEGVVKYDSYDPNNSILGDKTNIGTLGLNLFINKWAKIQTNYECKIEEGPKIKNNVFLAQFQVQY